MRHSALVLCILLSGCATQNPMTLNWAPAPPPPLPGAGAPVIGQPGQHAPAMIEFPIRGARKKPPRHEEPWKPLVFEDAPPPPDEPEAVLDAYRMACVYVQGFMVGEVANTDIPDTMIKSWLHSAKESHVQMVMSDDAEQRIALRRLGYISRLAALLGQSWRGEKLSCGAFTKELADRLRRAMLELDRALRSGNYRLAGKVSQAILDILKAAGGATP